MFKEPVLERFPEPLRRLETGLSYPVKIADTLIELSKQVGKAGGTGACLWPENCMQLQA